MVEVESYYFYIPMGMIFLYFVLCYLVRDNKKIWTYYAHIPIGKKSYSRKQIFTLCEQNFDKNIIYLPSFLRKTRKYYLSKELHKLNYNKFNIYDINYAQVNLLRKFILEKPDECLFIQNMSKPRDYFEMIGSLLVNNIDCVISIMVIDGPDYYFPEDFTILSILNSGSHMFYGKNNRRLNINVIEIEQDGEIIMIGDEIVENRLNFVTEIKTEYFSIRLFEINKNVKYGVSIVNNRYGLEKLELFYIGQLYEL